MQSVKQSHCACHSIVSEAEVPNKVCCRVKLSEAKYKVCYRSLHSKEKKSKMAKLRLYFAIDVMLPFSVLDYWAYDCTRMLTMYCLANKDEDH